MGCNSSRSKDIEQSQQRTRRPIQSQPVQPQHSTANKQRSESRAIGTTQNTQLSNNDDADDTLSSNVYGTSYTNRKTAEYELLNNIMKQTQYNFIDINNEQIITTQQIDEQADQERYKKYIAYIDLLQFDDSVLIQHKTYNKSVHTLLQYNHTLHNDDIELITTACENVSVAISDIHTKDVGKFVLTFDEL